MDSIKDNIYKGCSVFFRWCLVFCFLPLVFCRQKLFTIIDYITASALQKAYKYLIFSCLYCLFSVLVIHN